jgi:hypothetical protein
MGLTRFSAQHAAAATLALAAVGCASHPSSQQAAPVSNYAYDCRTDPWTPGCGPYFYPAFWPYPGYVLVPVEVLPAVPIPPLPPPHKPPRKPPHPPRVGGRRPCRHHTGSIAPICP